MNEYHIAKFAIDDYSTYQSWFQNKPLARALGDIDAAWLDYILTDKTGAELAMKDHAGRLRAVCGVAYPPAGGKDFVITNLATDPARQRQGIGSIALQLVMDYFPRCRRSIG